MAGAISTVGTATAGAPRSRLRWQSWLVAGLLALALAGVAVAAYLAWENSQGRSGVCTIAHGCSKVQQSRYGKMMGIPVSVPGLVLYTLLAVAAAAWLADLRGLRPVILVLAFYGALGGFLFSAYLTYLEAFVIDAWCIYCIASALIMTALFLGWSVMLWAGLRARSDTG